MQIPARTPNPAPGPAPARRFETVDVLGYRVPAGRPLELPGRGTTFVREMAGPEGAPTLILLHGLGATGALNWFPVFERLSRHFRVIAVDHRGHGRGIRSRRRFRLADCADDVVAVADQLGVDRFIAVGYSMGGPIAQLVWKRHPERVEGLVLCATSRDFRGRQRERVQFMAAGMLGLVARRLPGWRGPAGQERSRGAARWLADEASQTRPSAVLDAAAALGRFTSRRWIGAVDVPTSVVVTTEDQLVPPHRQLKLAAAIPTAVAHTIAGDHLVCGRHPELFTDVLERACRLVADRARHHAPALASL